MRFKRSIYQGMLVLSAVGFWLFALHARTPAEAPIGSFIVQGDDAAAVAELVRVLGGEITHDLELIDAVAADLTRGQPSTTPGSMPIPGSMPTGSTRTPSQAAT